MILPARPAADEFLFLALGGAGEIGMNLSLYGHDGKWLMVDLGIGFGDATTPGIDIVMPDPAAILPLVSDIVGLVLTHAHEDHLGAVAYLWPQLRCPVYATPFAAAILRRKLVESGFEKTVPVEILPLSARLGIGPFDVELLSLTHSIPEPNAVILRSLARPGLGAILHTGDWKLDATPVIGPSSDIPALRRLGESGVLAMVCDSTNVLVPGQSGSEAAVRAALLTIIGRLENRIAVACFSSNIARLHSIASAAIAVGRRCALVGRSLWRMVEAARETGYLADLPDFVPEHDIGFFPRRDILMICTGSQGEPRSALARIAKGDHPHVELEPGDAVIFSSRVIPGNEKAIAGLQNDLARLAIDVIADSEAGVHVSGHPAQEELAEMYHWVRPEIAIPVHGEARHIRAHAALARECQVPIAVEPRNGDLIRLKPGSADILAHLPSGRLGLDGRQLVPLAGEMLRQRHRLSYNGLAMVSLAIGGDGRLRGAPLISLEGLAEPEAEAEIVAGMSEAILAALAMPPPGAAGLAEAARLAARRWYHARFAKKPVVKVHLIQV